MSRLQALAILAFAPALLGASIRNDVEIRGNIALTDEVYLTVLDLAGIEKGAASEAKAEKVKNLLLRFMRGAGYELATIKARIDDGKVWVEVDEGRLDKVIFVDQGAIRTLELRLLVALPGQVYNKPLLERRLRALHKIGVRRANYEVVPVERVDDHKFQIQEPELVAGLTLLAPGEPHELRVFLEYESASSGLDLGLSLGAPDGAAVEVGYGVDDALLDRDNVYIRARLGARVIGLFGSKGAELGLSRARLGVEWWTPPLITEILRTSLAAEIDLMGRSREDLGLSQYYYSPIRGALILDLAPFSGFRVSMGAGVERRILFGLEGTMGMIPAEVLAESQDQTRLFGVARMLWSLDWDELRKDRRTPLEILARYYLKGTDGARPMWALEVGYDRVWGLGWDELRLGGRGALLAPEAPYYLHIPLGDDYLRAAYTDQFSDKVVGINAEYRLSLSRDLLKVGVFNDAVAARDVTVANDKIRFFESFGLGLHVLFLDAFQLSTYAGVGFSTTRDPVAFGFSLQLKQIF
jgi:hypothetical protein